MIEVLRCLRSEHVKVCFMYGFSSKNWKRPVQEIEDIFQVIERTATKVKEDLLHDEDGNCMTIKILGDLDNLPIASELR